MKSANFPLFSPFKPEKSLVNMFHVLFIVIMLIVGDRSSSALTSLNRPPLRLDA